MNTELARPYLSVVVTTRNDDHGGDPLKRLQAFVNSFEAQCRLTGLDAELIVVEWNPPADKPRVSSLLRLPLQPVCAYRFIDVPAELHQRLQFADVLPLFQMIAKNVGIRRARGQFVLATNIDIIFSNELIEFIAARQLQPGRLYRVDRHDMQPDFPVDASLEEQMADCASHQLRVHSRNGSYPVDAAGRPVALLEDIVDGKGVAIGTGWHVRESVGPGRPFRWASDAVTLRLDPAATSDAADSVLSLDVESSPYDAGSCVEIAITEGAATLRTVRLAGRRRIAVALGAPRSAPRTIELRVAKPHPEWRQQLPIFERREAMHYRVYSATVSRASEPAGFDYPLDRWQTANPMSELTMTVTPEGLTVASDRRKSSYCVRYGPLRAPRRGVHRVELVYTILEGRIGVGILSGGDRFWIPATVTPTDDSDQRRLEISVELPSSEAFSVVVFNDHPEGDGVSRFVIHAARGTCDPLPAVARSRRNRLSRWPLRLTSVLAASRAGTWKAAIADRLARWLSRAVGRGVRYRIARESQEYRNLETALRSSDQQLRALAPLQDVAELHRFLRERRPENLHANGCGDFQMMAREHWDELRGYPEFETFSMNIDGLFGYIAAAAGVEEQMLEMPIYHFEHEVGSGWSPEGEALLRQRIAERGITWVDASTVYVWAAYMAWLQRPMIFNGAHWGMATATLIERTPAAPSGAAS